MSEKIPKRETNKGKDKELISDEKLLLKVIYGDELTEAEKARRKEIEDEGDKFEREGLEGKEFEEIRAKLLEQKNFSKQGIMPKLPRMTEQEEQRVDEAYKKWQEKQPKK